MTTHQMLRMARAGAIFLSGAVVGAAWVLGIALFDVELDKDGEK